MYRKIFSKLIDWKRADNRKPLLLLGARQVGKTWLMKEFGREEYSNIAYINCDEEPLTKNLFTGDYDIERLIIAFQAITGETINPHTTLIILDEIQEAPRGLHSLKYFCENAPEYHIIAAGSLLGVTLSQQESFPVGKVNMLHLYPLDFGEFLLALGEKELYAMLEKHDHSLEHFFSSKLTDLLRQYYYVGGMPEAVSEYSETKNLNQIRKIQSDILQAYRNDISKHTTKTESIRISQVLDSLPTQLSRENKRFIFGAARPGGRAADFEMAIQWLIDAGLVYKIPRVTKIASPLKFYQELTAFKLFFLDVGLLCCMSDVKASTILLESDALVEYKGMLAEQYTAQQLISAGFSPFYWSNDKSPAELDFIIETENDVYPVEVKASTNVRGKSIAQYAQNNPGKRGIRFSLLGYQKQDWLTNYPLFTMPFYFKEGEISEV